MFGSHAKRIGRRSFRLFSRPSFVEGAARLMDLAGSLNSYNTSPSSADADRYAMQSDWRAVGDDLWYALDRYKHERNRAKQALWKANKKKEVSLAK